MVDSIHGVGVDLANPDLSKLGRQLSRDTLAALRKIEGVRGEELRKLSASDRRDVAWAEHQIAIFIDLRAQMDADA